MDIAAAILESQLTLAGIVVLMSIGAIFAFAKGWIYTSSQIDRQMSAQTQAMEAAITRGTEWQAAYYAERDKNTVLVKQVEQISVVAVVVNKILTSLPEPQARRDE
jgi:hypothetical protein